MAATLHLLCTWVAMVYDSILPQYPLSMWSRVVASQHPDSALVALKSLLHLGNSFIKAAESPFPTPNLLSLLFTVILSVVYITRSRSVTDKVVYVLLILILI